MPKRFVYKSFRNADNPPRYYTGLTADVATRLMEHNAGSCSHTASTVRGPIDVVIEFGEERRAVAFGVPEIPGQACVAHRHLR